MTSGVHFDDGRTSSPSALGRTHEADQWTEIRSRRTPAFDTISSWNEGHLIGQPVSRGVRVRFAERGSLKSRPRRSLNP